MAPTLYLGEIRHGRTHAVMLLAGSLMLGAALHPAPARAEKDGHSRTPQQMLFWEAKQALEAGDDARFGRLASRLGDAPLYPYLVYWQLQRRLSQQLPLTIDAFLQRYADLPLAPLLRHRWLRHLAREQRWNDYLAFYAKSDDVELKCHYHLAQHRSGNDAAAWAGAKELWLVGNSQDSACDPLFSAWKQAGGLTSELIWKRIELAMENGNSDFATLIARSLPAKDQHWLSLWQHANDHPGLLSSSGQLREDSEMSRLIAFHTLRYRALRSPTATADLWGKLQDRYAFDPKQRTAIERAIAIGFSYDRNELALEWFARLPLDERDLEVCDQAMRVALRHQRWASALAWLQAMPASESHSSRGQYWRGRIYEAMGFTDTARVFFQRVSKERDYYGFLAADKLNLPYNLNDDPLEVSDAVMARTASLPGIVRARELYDLGLVSTARREWDYAVERMDRKQMLAAGKLAKEMGWKDRALLTLAKADHFDDLSIRFPLSFTDTVFREAERRNLDPSWVYAVVRQESAMMPFVQSPVGALGLMQLMPQTGRAMAQKLQLDQPNRRQLLKPETNIRLGSYYLRQVLQQFNHNPVLATAAYNAGPHRIRKWYPKNGAMDADIWVDTIPFDETREYVRMVMAYAVFYDRRLAQPVKRLRDRMPPIGKGQAVSHCGNCGQDKTAILAQAEPALAH